MPAILTPGSTGPFTCEDVWAMPDDGRRRELIDGVLIVSPSPGLAHQRALTRLLVLFASACPPDLEVLPGPFDYKIRRDTMLVPDIIVARKVDYGPKRLEKTPILLIEVRSPSTGRLDAGSKRLTYEAAGVEWYWMFDPVEPRLTVLHLVEGAYVEAANVSGTNAYDATEPIALRVIPADLVND